VNGTLTVGQATLTVTAANASRAYGAANPAFTGTETGAINGDTFTVGGSTTATTSSPAGTYAIVPTVTGANLSNYTVVYVNGTLTVGQATPTITWTAPAPITYGTTLSTTQLDATASVPGNFTYSPALGTTPAAGLDTLTATFTPTDTTNYATTTATVQLTVNKGTPTITWAAPAPITYGTALGATQLNATANVPGSFTYSPATGSVPAAGTDTLSVSFTPTDTSNYTTATATVDIVVNKATPTITWANPAAITYGTALSSVQMDATATPSGGTFVYSPAAGTVLPAGTNTLSVIYTPADTSNYTTATASAQIVVNTATLSVTAADATRSYGTANPAFTGTYTGVVNGDTFTVSGSTAATQSSPAGTYAIVPSVTGADLADYTVVYVNGTLTITKVVPTISWPTPSPITYGTALSSTQLDATGSVPGTFVYNPAASTVLTTGSNTLTATFTPTDTTDYTTQTASVNLTVIAATPVINWNNPAPIVYGTALSSTQLNATSSTTGAFTYTPAAGTVLSVGTQPLNVTLTPTDTTNYTTATKTVTVDVTQASLVVTANNATKVYGTANPTFTGTITGAQNGDTFTEAFSTTATTLSNVGTYAIVPSASGTDIADYSQTINNGTLAVTKASVISSLSLSTTDVPYEIPVTMTVTLQSATSGTPTGTVSFYDNGNLIGTSPVVGNTATFTSGGLTSPLPMGNNVISTLYSGDQNFYAQTAGSTASSGSVLVTPLDFSFVSTSPTTLHGIYGTSGTYTFHVAPIGGSYPGDVVFTVNGTNGPILAKYTFSQDKVGMYAGQADLTLTVSTRLLAPSDRHASLVGPIGSIALGLFLFPLASTKRFRRSSRKLARVISMAALVLLTLGGITSLSGCGSGYPSVDDPIVVIATSNGIQHTITINYHIDKSPQDTDAK
ncbi:beta strand repeat-containing protein, partial [Edaphobacter acidisoli]|uniref:beta strand repeat-containing protein n=1 Tax=Edaphobacter acidisoli TaxID=2040573 RepID=UPI0016641573